jgi:DNA-binding CsgD family transcriptional regulator
MSRDHALIALIDLIYEATLDNDLWPEVLIKLADVIGASQVSMTSRDQRADIFKTLSPRTDPDFLASYRQYWRLQNPLWQRTISWRVGEIYRLDNLVPRKDYSATPVFNEWWRPSGRGLAAAGVNLLVEEQFSALVYFANRPGMDVLTDQQLRTFNMVLPHLTRALRINRRLWEMELKHVAATERLEAFSQGVLLADASGRVVRANASAKAMLDDGSGIIFDKGRLAVASGSELLQKMIVSCALTSPVRGSPGGELKIPREPPRSPLDVTVAPLRSKIRLTEVPWIGVGTPVAIVTVSDPDIDRRRRETNLRRRFNLTAAESRLAVEILKGDGRAAAARRRGIADATAKTQLATIFEKTKTHRQAELIRLLLDAANAQGTDE